MFCFLQTKQPIDYLLALLPIIISFAVALIAWSQYRTAKNKLRLDLYNRRFAVYDKTLSYYQVYYLRELNSEMIQNSAAEFIHAYRESLFLFGRESGVYKVLTEIKDTFGYLIAYDARLKSDSIDKDELYAWYKIKESKPDPTKLMESLEQALMPWLDFQKI